MCVNTAHIYVDIVCICVTTACHCVDTACLCVNTANGVSSHVLKTNFQMLRFVSRP